ncbi:DNA-binding transcriptional LysR family regulator [Murinocardiopsis flavida]|uniref:DNA-binding transcriptional LysR family regulator n=1 Tax=Murinocardiopsis flavida TaxID=645275 RepID=A0A2P8DTU4_9ACTN|nr:LysR family transcriptional regulator [Murinocardiopsis flavida]PSL00612.1 DNA-binding transcriptional LysR family regulator [Murinocardiopsis flavida]
MFSLDRLRALAAVAAHGSIARAALALHVTPSGVSQQLGKLERESGHRLLEPHGRSVRLTHAGRVLAEHAARVMAQLAAAESDLADMRAEILGPLRIAAIGSAVRALLPEVLARLTQEHPRLTPSVRDGEVIDMMPALLGGDLDLLLIESWAHRPVVLPEGLVVQPLVREEAHVALSVRHPLADRETVDLAELAGTPWTSCLAGTEPYEALVQALRVRGVEPDIRYTVAEYATQFALVEADLAAALVPAMARRSVPPGIRFVATSAPLRREIKAVWRASSENPPIRACVAALRARSDAGPGSVRRTGGTGAPGTATPA